MDFYVYAHKKKTTGVIFYIGKGSADRAWSKSGRSKIWHNTVNKHGLIVEILECNLQEWWAFELEKNLIALYGRLTDKAGPLVNLTDGGEGMSGTDHPLYDPREWTFINLDTDEVIRTTKYSFNKLKPHVHTGALFTGAFSCHRWYVRELLTDEELNAVKSGFKREYSTTGDKSTYDFVWLATGECFSKTRFEMLEFTPDLNISALLLGNLKMSKGWSTRENFDRYGADYLLNYNAGQQNGRANLNIYDFKNMITGEIFRGTRFDFQRVYGFNPRDLFTERLNYVVKDWCLLSNYDLALSSGQMDYTHYRFVSKDGQEFTGTRGQFKEKFGHSVKPLFGKNPFKNCKGWYLSPKETEEFS